MDDGIQVLRNQKSERIALLLSIFCGLVGLCGIGHFYCYSKWKGLIFLVAGWTLIVADVLILIPALNPVWVFQNVMAVEGETTFIFVYLLIVGYFVTYFLQMYDSLRSCRKYNLSLDVQLGSTSVVATELMSERAKIKLTVCLVILAIIGGVFAYHVYAANKELEYEQQQIQLQNDLSQLARNTPAYVTNYQKWKDCIQNTDGIYSHESSMGYCGEDMLPPIYTTTQVTQTQQAQQMPQVQTPLRQQAQQTHIQQAQQANFTSNPSGATSTIYTNLGEIKIQLFDNVAPKTVANFEKLANSGFYDGTVFHRIIPGFVIQGGDPNTRNGPRDTWGIGDAGYTIPAEFSNLEFTKYMVGMARESDINSGSSQFFITLGNDSSLNDRYTLFGKVVSGQDIVDKIASINTDASTAQPLDPNEARIIKIVINN